MIKHYVIIILNIRWLFGWPYGVGLFVGRIEMVEYIPVSVPFNPRDHPAVMYCCDGCTYNLGPGGLFPEDSRACALAWLEGDYPVVWRRRPYPCGYVNPWPRYRAGRRCHLDYVG